MRLLFFIDTFNGTLKISVTTFLINFIFNSSQKGLVAQIDCKYL